MTMTAELNEDTDRRDATELLEQLREQEERTQKELAHQWQAIVASVADGHTGDLADMQRKIAESGHSIADLEAAVSLILKRRAWRAEVDGQPAAESTIHRTTEAIAKAEEEYRAAIEKYNSTTCPLLDQREAAANAIVRAFHARRELIATCADRDALAAIQAIDERMAEVRREIADITDRMETKRRAAVDWQQKDPRGKATDIERVRGEVAAMQSALDKLREETDQLNRDRIAAEDAMLVPEAI